jgi:hypothetical protein
MVRLRETVNSEERQGLTLGPTRHITATNHYGVHCADCGELYYVDESTMGRIRSAHEGDRSEVPFRCDDCEDESAEQEFGR